MSDTLRRTALVANGLCAFCGKPRGRWKYLCDSCGDKHRERQRFKAKIDAELAQRHAKRDRLLAWLKKKRGMV